VSVPSREEACRAPPGTSESFVCSCALGTLHFTDEDARSAGVIRHELERAGTPIGAYDTLIAGQALQRGLTLVTANVAGFQRVGGLRWENWAP
jgi:tRNA(fMet)-specific endonuclease VapC